MGRDGTADNFDERCYLEPMRLEVALHWTEPSCLSGPPKNIRPTSPMIVKPKHWPLYCAALELSTIQESEVAPVLRFPKYGEVLGLKTAAIQELLL